MSPELLRQLEAMRPQIRARWEALLRIEKTHTPLANPDTLVFMFDLTLDEVLAALPGHRSQKPVKRPTCRYETNPMRVYFPALEQALLEALIEIQAQQPAAKGGKHSAAVTERADALEELRAQLHRIAHREITAFDAMVGRAAVPQRRKAPAPGKAK